MITFFEANLANLAVHHVGNPVLDEGFSISDHESDIADDLKKQLLTKYFLFPFQKSQQVYQFYHPSGNVELNHVYSICEYFFNENFYFLETSEGFARALYAATRHPKIKSGELYIALFDNVQIEGELLSAVGIFKSESKETYLKVNPAAGAIEVSYEQDAVNINNLDKGCLIFNTDHDNGYKVAVIDSSGKSDNSYWVDDFLQVRLRNDSYTQTSNFLGIYKNFVTDRLDDEFEMSNSGKVDLLNKGLQYFEDKESFDIDEFAAEVIGNDQAATSLKSYKEDYETEFECSIPESFQISDIAVKKQSRSYKKVLKLDNNFELKIKSDTALIERGFDDQMKLNYYKVYFKQESI